MGRKVVASLVITPLGTCSPSVSKYVAVAENVLSEMGLKHMLTPMATVIEAEEEEIFRAVVEIKRRIFEMGVQRVVYTLKVDDRLDKRLTMDGKIEAVRRQYKR
jgi:uncharacterized protein (TIGR00106 family)